MSSLLDKRSILLRDVLSVGELPVKPNPILTRSELQSWPHLHSLSLPELRGDVMLLIGVNTPEAFWVMEERRGNADEPHAVRTTLGWSLLGPRRENSKCLWSESCQEVAINYVKVSDALLTKQIDCLWRVDDVPSYRRDISLSKEDCYALHLLKELKKIVEGHYQFALPWKPGAPRLIDNYQQAVIKL